MRLLERDRWWQRGEAAQRGAEDRVLMLRPLFSLTCSNIRCTTITCSAVTCSAVTCLAVTCSLICSNIMCSAVTCLAVTCSPSHVFNRIFLTIHGFTNTSTKNCKQAGRVLPELTAEALPKSPSGLRVLIGQFEMTQLFSVLRHGV